MSRVIGFVGDVSLSLIEECTSRLKQHDRWKTQIKTLGQATFGWAGWKEPALFQEDSLLAVLDGQIFNRDSLGEYVSDLACLVDLYRKYGIDQMASSINGDLAFALYDREKESAYLIRDRVGVKPLYYAEFEDSLAFSSHPTSLLPLKKAVAVNSRYVACVTASHYRLFDNERSRSPYKDIDQLPAANLLKFSNQKIKKQTYWRLSDQENFSDPEEILAEKYRDLLQEAVACRLRVTDRPAFTLSGGMDSSSVLAQACDITKTKQFAFSSVYRDKTYDESEDIQTILASHVEKWFPIPVEDVDVFDLVEKMVNIHGEPVATATWLSHFLLARAVRENGFHSLFGGLGGDELNAGEYEYFFFYFADLMQAGEEALLSREIDFWVRHHDHPLFKKGHQVAREGVRRLTDSNLSGRTLADRPRMLRYAQALEPDYFDIENYEPQMSHEFSSYLKNRTYQDIFWETAPCCLRAEDRHSTYHELDHFLPFYDYRLLEFMFRNPGELKIRNGVTKYLLRQAMKNLLPEETRNRIKKTGWNAPAHLWFSGKGADAINDLIRSQKFRERGIYRVTEVERLLKEHQKIVSENLNQENHMMFFWQLINCELWLQSIDRI